MTASSRWTLRDLLASDAELLADFHCAGDGAAYSTEVEQWVRTSVVRWVSEVTDPAARPGGLLLVEANDGQPIAVSAFELGQPLVIDDVHVPAVRVQVLALGNQWQGTVNGDGVRFSTMMLEATLDRIKSGWPDAPITAVIVVDNDKSSILFRRAGFPFEMPHPTRPGYNLFLRPPDDE